MAILLMRYVPRNRIREAWVIFTFKQFMTWLFGLMVVEKKFIRYPHRLLFKKATKSSFTFEYFVYPALCVLFILHYPKNKRNANKIIYYAGYTSLITFFEWIALKYTKLIRYRNWSLLRSFVTVWITYYFSELFHRWFFKDRSLKEKIF